MVKRISLILLCLVFVTTCFAACSKKEASDEEESAGLEGVAEEYGFEIDENGNEVAVVYGDDGKAYVIDQDGNKTGKTIKVTTTKKDESKTTTAASNTPGSSPEKQPDREDVDNNTKDETGTTKSELTTLPFDEDVVPSTSASGTPVQFSDKDVKTLTNMLEVPYLYTASYENSNKVPIEVATHVACWMLQRENLNTNTFASGTVVIDLFNYFARTVVQFKTDCNTYTSDGAVNPAPLSYDSINDTFSVTSSSYEKATHRIEITQIEDLGGNNYYKVTAKVTGIDKSCKAKKLVAVVQKNKLDTSLGFSVKALKWG